MRNLRAYSTEEDYKLNPPSDPDESICYLIDTDIIIYGIQSPSSDPSILLESGGYLLLESGGRILLEN